LGNIPDLAWKNSFFKFTLNRPLVTAVIQALFATKICNVVKKIMALCGFQGFFVNDLLQAAKFSVLW